MSERIPFRVGNEKPVERNIKLMKTMIEMLENSHEALTVKDIARILGDSTQTVYRKVKEGKIEGAFRDGRSIRFCPAIFVEWLKRKIAERGKADPRTDTSRLRSPSVRTGNAPAGAVPPLERATVEERPSGKKSPDSLTQLV